LDCVSEKVGAGISGAKPFYGVAGSRVDVVGGVGFRWAPQLRRPLTRRLRHNGCLRYVGRANLQLRPEVRGLSVGCQVSRLTVSSRASAVDFTVRYLSAKPPRQFANGRRHFRNTVREYPVPVVAMSYAFVSNWWHLIDNCHSDTGMAGGAANMSEPRTRHPRNIFEEIDCGRCYTFATKTRPVLHPPIVDARYCDLD
jgi:hypothetical protein